MKLPLGLKIALPRLRNASRVVQMMCLPAWQAETPQARSSGLPHCGPERLARTLRNFWELCTPSFTLHHNDYHAHDFSQTLLSLNTWISHHKLHSTIYRGAHPRLATRCMCHIAFYCLRYVPLCATL